MKLIARRFFCFLFSLLLLASSGPFSLYVRSSDEYKFFDAQGNEIKIPANVPIHTRRNPGPWKETAAWHEPKIYSKIRRYGLETVRIINIKIPHPMNAEKEGSIKGIYLSDKDNLIVGYRGFKPEDKEASAEIWINGVINFIYVYVLCSRHDLWRYDYVIQ